MFLEVKKAVYIADYKLRVEFNDGTIMTVDLESDLIGKVFEPLKNKDLFQAFSIKHNTVEWTNGADFAPEYLYTKGIRE